jgi:RNA polymerase sigma-70 factor (ECF subfamily)
MTDREQLECFSKLSAGDEKAFEALFRIYYASLCHLAAKIVKDHIAAEEVVQETFVKIWDNRKNLKIDTSVKNYLFMAVRNRCLNRIEYDRIRYLHAKKILVETPEEAFYSFDYIDPGLADKIEASILSLPEKRREIFRLNREEGLKYREIAEKLNLSLKTVEAQMGLALKTLREKLKEFNITVLFLIFFKYQ